MSNIIVTCHNLMETNDGKYKSEKQKNFLLSQAVFGVISHSGVTYNVRWVDSFDMDEEGIVRYTRDSNKKGLTVIWERGNQTAAQKKAAKHEVALQKHYKMEKELFEIFEKDSISTFGYVLDAEKVRDLYSAIQSCSIETQLRNAQISEYANIVKTFSQYINAFEEIKACHEIASEFMTKYRIIALEQYNTKFTFSFL